MFYADRFGRVPVLLLKRLIGYRRQRETTDHQRS